METKRKGLILFSDIERYSGLKKAVTLSRSDILSEVRGSNLRGRGGAGFPTGVKWNLVATAQSGIKYVVCNADEGEPGTFKDRVLLREYPRLVLEGMIIAALACNAKEGYLYLRGEYKSFVPQLKEALKSMRKEGLLGKDILGKEGFDFDIELRLGSGAYVCGEETGLIESLEGNRGEPRNKPPFPVNTGYNGCPTVINNVETFAVIPHIMAKGAEWFKNIGTEKSAGTKLVSVSGDCARPGVYEVEFGITIKDILKLAEAKDAKAVSAGASGECVPCAKFGRRLGFEDFSTGGSIIVYGKKRSMLDVLKDTLEFFEEESCGQCTPCREGIPVLLEGVELMKTGTCPKDYLKDLLSLSETMQLASKCGLGQSSPNMFISVVNNFKKEYTLSKIPKKERPFNG